MRSAAADSLSTSESENDDADDNSDSSDCSSPLGAAYILPVDDESDKLEDDLQLRIKEV